MHRIRAVPFHPKDRIGTSGRRFVPNKRRQSNENKDQGHGWDHSSMPRRRLYEMISSTAR